jgi:glycosyltransferase involved in cell wall biosynthesis
MPKSATTQVSVLLATYNGEVYLQEQLDSILNQTHPDINIIASDDGSTDTTLKILKSHNIQTHKGPCQGFTANFFNLITKAPDDSAYYAFSDQDDVWESNKLQRAIDALEALDTSKPALYCSRTALVDAHLAPMGYSPLFKKKPHFLNALVQNIAGGNTMVFNQAGLKLLRQTKNPEKIAAHDWWTYLLITGAGGTIIYDSIPSILYRQHPNNLIGNNMSYQARYHRLRLLFQGRLKTWINQNNQNLLDVLHLLTPEHQAQLKAFEHNRPRSLLPRLINLFKLGIYRQTVLGQIGLLFGIGFNKI